MNKTQTKRFEKVVTKLESGSVSLAKGDAIRAQYSATQDSEGRPALGSYLDKQADSNVGGIDTFLLSIGIDDLDAAERIAVASTSTHSPVQNAKRSARALRRVVAQAQKA